MNSCAPIIPTCGHTFSDGRHCQGAAVRGRACCRHHLDAQARLHNMARARRCTLALRLRVPETSRDLAWNKIELNRVLVTESTKRQGEGVHQSRNSSPPAEGPPFRKH